MYFHVIEKFSDLNTTLTYVLMDNFCPCFSPNSKVLLARKNTIFLLVIVPKLTLFYNDMFSV